ncbi:MAG: SAM hydrolase/SAM-dependent halogenase family protein [Longimicrobiales bacterium]
MRPDEQQHRSASANAPARIVLLTDFGTRDGYTAAMRGVISSIAPHAVIDDATHEIAPGDVDAAAYVLARYARFHPPATIHLAVVDPGVGSERRALAAEVDGQYYVAPDNGLITRVLQRATKPRIVALTNTEYRLPELSATFHGRDVFAPAAAWLARGIPLHELGPPIDDPVLLELKQPRYDSATIRGVVEHIDRFGNLITNIAAHSLSADSRVKIEGHEIGPLRGTYADVEPGEVIALAGSDGMLEIAVRDGSAADALPAKRGAKVLVHRELQQDR